MKAILSFVLLTLSFFAGAQTPRVKQYIGFDTATDVIIRGALVLPNNISRSGVNGGLRMGPGNQLQVWDIDAQAWQLVQGNGGLTYEAKALNVTPGANETTDLQSAFDNASVGTILASEKGTYIINGSVNAHGKRLQLTNGAKFSGTGTIDSLYVDAPDGVQLFDATLTVKNIFNRVKVSWFGAKADNGVTDNLGPFQRAIAAIAEYYTTLNYGFSGSGRIDIEPSRNFYGFSATLILNRGVRLIGDHWTTTSLVFPSTSDGIVIQRNDADTTIKQALWPEIRQLSVYGTGQSAVYTAAGIRIKTQALIEDVNVRNFSGDGIAVVANVGQGTNANNSMITRTHVYNNNRHGLYISGHDANMVTVTALDAVGNGEWGIFDSSFLGCNFFSCHSASNGNNLPQFSRAMVYLSGTNKTYKANIPNTNKNPSTNPDGWSEVGTGRWSTYTPDWDSAVTYQSSGSYNSQSDANTQSTYVGCYAEDDDNQPRLNGRSIMFGGFAAYKGVSGGNVIDGAARVNYLQTYPADDASFLQIRKKIPGLKSNLFWNTVGGNGGFGADGTLGIYVNVGNLDAGYPQVWNMYNSMKDILGKSQDFNGYSQPIFLTQPHFPVYNGAFTYTGGRSIQFFDSIPVSFGKWDAGDFAINKHYNGTSDKNIGWICTVAGDFSGTPPVFKAIESGAGKFDGNGIDSTGAVPYNFLSYDDLTGKFNKNQYQTMDADSVYAQQIIRALTTTNATPTVAFTYTPQNAETVTIEVDCLSLNNTNASYSAKKRRKFFFNGSLSSNSIKDIDGDEYLGSGLSTATFTITASGGNIIVQFTGEASKTIYSTFYISVHSQKYSP